MRSVTAAVKVRLGARWLTSGSGRLAAVSLWALAGICPLLCAAFTGDSGEGKSMIMFCAGWCGVVLYTGDRVVPFGERLCAVPLSVLWSGASEQRPQPE